MAYAKQAASHISMLFLVIFQMLHNVGTLDVTTFVMRNAIDYNCQDC
jgi:hypothetical protein